MASKTGAEIAVAEQDVERQSVAVITDPALLARFAEMATAIPAMEEKGMEDILRQVFAAKTWQDVDKPWRTSRVDDIIGKDLRVTSVRRLPSRYRDGLGIFLVVKMWDAREQKEYVKATGAIAVVGQFVQLYFMGVTALTIRWCQAKEPTEDGYYPQHLEIIDAHVPGQDGVE